MDAEALREFDELAQETGEGLWPCSVVLAGATLQAQAPRPRLSLGLIQGSEEVLAELVVRIRKEVLPTEPAIDSILEAHGRAWLVREVGGNEVDAAWRLRCEPKN